MNPDNHLQLPTENRYNEKFEREPFKDKTENMKYIYNAPGKQKQFVGQKYARWILLLPTRRGKNGKVEPRVIVAPN